MRAGIIAGSVAAIAAVLLSLPLYSPSDTLFNSASVAAGSLVAGVVAGLLWNALPAGPRRLRRFVSAWAVLFALTVVALFAGETQIDRMLEFGLPLAALVFAVSGVLTPALDRPLPRRWHAPASAVPVIAPLLALALGVALVGQGDGESGTLSLPAPAGVATAGSGTATTAGSGTAAAAGSEAAAAAGTTIEVGSPDDVAGVSFIVGEGSEVTFTVNEKLSRLPLPNDAVVRTDALSGTLHLDGRSSTVEIDLLQLESDQSRRDSYIRTRMFPDYPIATITFDALPELPESYVMGEIFEGEVSGRLLILGVEHLLTFTVEARIDPDALLILGRTTFTWDEIEVPRPTFTGVEVEDEVRVEVLITARPAADSTG